MTHPWHVTWDYTGKKIKSQMEGYEIGFVLGCSRWRLYESHMHEHDQFILASVFRRWEKLIYAPSHRYHLSDPRVPCVELQNRRHNIGYTCTICPYVQIWYDTFRTVAVWLHCNVLSAPMMSKGHNAALQPRQLYILCPEYLSEKLRHWEVAFALWYFTV